MKTYLVFNSAGMLRNLRKRMEVLAEQTPAASPVRTHSVANAENYSFEVLRVPETSEGGLGSTHPERQSTFDAMRHRGRPAAELDRSELSQGDHRARMQRLVDRTEELIIMKRNSLGLKERNGLERLVLSLLRQ